MPYSKKPDWPRHTVGQLNHSEKLQMQDKDPKVRYQPGININVNEITERDIKKKGLH